MAKFNKESFAGELEEFIAPFKENGNSDWIKGVARIKWGDNPTTLDIRSMNVPNQKFGKGVSLSDEEADSLVDILLDEGYGTVSAIEDAIEKRKGIYTTIDKNKVNVYMEL